MITYTVVAGELGDVFYILEEENQKENQEKAMRKEDIEANIKERDEIISYLQKSIKSLKNLSKIFRKTLMQNHII